VPAGIQPVPVKAHHPDPVIEFLKDAHKKVLAYAFNFSGTSTCVLKCSDK